MSGYLGLMPFDLNALKIHVIGIKGSLDNV